MRRKRDGDGDSRSAVLYNEAVLYNVLADEQDQDEAVLYNMARAYIG